MANNLYNCKQRRIIISDIELKLAVPMVACDEKGNRLENRVCTECQYHNWCTKTSNYLLCVNCDIPLYGTVEFDYCWSCGGYKYITEDPCIFCGMCCDTETQYMDPILNPSC
jgi:hypothetical protein